MFPNPLRSSKSERCLRRLKKGRPDFSSSHNLTKDLSIPQKLDFHADTQLLDCPIPVARTPLPARPSRCTGTRNVNRETIFIDLTNNDLLPALDYAFAILDADNDSSSPIVPDGSYTVSSDQTSNSSESAPHTPSSPTCSGASVGTSVRSTPPRYVYVPSPLTSAESSPFPSPTRFTQERRLKTIDSCPEVTFDPNELSRALTHATSNGTPQCISPSPERPGASVPFPPPATPHSKRTPLLQRKPRMIHSAEPSIDEHDPFSYRSYPGSSNVSLVRSLSSLDHRRDYFTSRVCPSTTSVDTLDSGLAAVLPWRPSLVRTFSSPKRSRPIPSRRASTPPQTRSRFGIPSLRPPVPALQDVFLCPSATRKDPASLLT